MTREKLRLPSSAFSLTFLRLIFTSSNARILYSWRSFGGVGIVCRTMHLHCTIFFDGFFCRSKWCLKERSVPARALVKIVLARFELASSTLQADSRQILRRNVSCRRSRFNSSWNSTQKSDFLRIFYSYFSKKNFRSIWIFSRKVCECFWEGGKISQPPLLVHNSYSKRYSKWPQKRFYRFAFNHKQ